MSLPVVDCTLPRPLAPQASAFTRTFWQALADGRLTTTRCEDCREWSFPPRPVCTRCGSASQAWQTLSGHGRLYSCTRVHAAGGAFAAYAPYSVGIVDLDEGLRLLTRVMPDASALPLDAAVQIVVLRHPDGVLFAAAAAR
jgi:uncharacterized OB-fold protein